MYKRQLVGKGKSALGAEPLHVAGSNEALVQDDLITLQSPVSYTHLDVYKRQVPGQPLNVFGSFAGISRLQPGIFLS